MNDASGETSDTKPAATQPVSERQLAANRRNAAKSTGPRTRDGKGRASMNRLKHGLYATTHASISRGQFYEHRTYIEEFIDGLLDSLEPRDALEYVAAQRVAQAFLVSERLERFQLAAIEGDTTLEPDIIELLGNPVRSRRHSDLVEVITELTTHSWCDLGPDRDFPLFEWSGNITFRDLAIYLRHSNPANITEVPGVWDHTHTPQSDNHWRAAYIGLMQSGFVDLDQARTWLQSQYEHHQTRFIIDRGKPESVAAQRVLNSSLEKALRHRARIDRALDSALTRFYKLQARTLDHDNESNSQHHGADDTHKGDATARNEPI